MTEEKKKVELSGQQQLALERAEKWLSAHAEYKKRVEEALEAQVSPPPEPKQIFRLFGFAGTGKTTIAKQLVQSVKGEIKYGAFTGKAALVMRRNGMDGAQTLHSLIYELKPFDKVEYGKMKEDRKKAEDKGDAVTAAKLLIKMKEMASPKFTLNTDSSLKDAELLVLDECSMVDDNLLDDIKSFDVPILVLGDPGQLPPINGDSSLTSGVPDIQMTTIHRQALDNPIIQMSMQAREKGNVQAGEYRSKEGNFFSQKIKKEELTKNLVLNADQVLCGKNKTRYELNKKIRHHLGHTSTYPEVGEKLICLQNDKEKRIFNGMLCVVKKSAEGGMGILLTVESEEGKEYEVEAHKGYFDEYNHPGTLKKLTSYDFKGLQQFDFGYAITVHKSQGSQWDSVLFYDDKFFVWDWPQRKKWLYTGITRAAVTLTIAG